jgi:catechol 2,3-dioxygenase-like lactoylglutathione lyase family enzyme
MIGYVTLGISDIDRAQSFYDALLGSIGGKRLMEIPDHGGLTMYGTDFGTPAIAITQPYDGGTASAGNGTMVAIPMDERGKVDAFHAKAIALGGTDEGAPGLRGEEGPQAFYGAYFRDPDGNKLCAFRIGGA